MKSSARAYFRCDLKSKQMVQVCNKEITERVVWRKIGNFLKVKRPHHEGCR